MNYPKTFQQLIDMFKLLPGVGTKTAERYAFSILSLSQEKLEELSKVIGQKNKAIIGIKDINIVKGIQKLINGGEAIG